jgi:cytochrome c
MRAPLLILVAAMLVACIVAGKARARCAEDLTRIELALPSAPAEVKQRVQPLLRDAQAEARKPNSTGCDEKTAQALDLLQLPHLAPLVLSTPIADAQVVAQANMPSGQGQATASPDARNPTGTAPSKTAVAARPGSPATAERAQHTPAASAGSGPASESKADAGQGATGPTAASGQVGGSANAAPAGGDVAHGRQLAQTSCGPCHSFDRGGAARVGPDLYGVAGRKVASVPGFNYSAGLKAHQGENWTPGDLDSFLKSPAAFAPGTMMAFPGIVSDSDRRDIIAYLESLNANSATGASK